MTPEGKREAWVRFAAEVAAVGVSLDGGLTTDVTTNATLANHCGAVADALLSEVEQREREGRFGPAADEVVTSDYADLQANRDEWMERAQRAEAEVERAAYRQSQLASEETRWQDGEEADDGLARAELEGRAEKAESLLKEALKLLGRHGEILIDLSAAEFSHYAADLLARARQEGFSDGE